ncbi:MAG: outer rane efflux protein [Chlamydiales bacterium]|jgi:outer membrane protein TolC|nr:outer rane efflux protein [Chlamydiales bacterium]
MLFFLFLLSCQCAAANPITLEEAELHLLQNNRQLAILKKEMQKQALVCKSSLSSAFPKISLEFGMSNQRQESKLTLRDEIFSWGNILTNRIDQIDLDLLKINYYLEANSLLYTLRSQYYKILLFQERIQSEKESVQLFREALELERKKCALGESTELNLKQGKVALNAALSLYFQAERDLKLAKAALGEMLGLEAACSSTLSLAETEIPALKIPQLADKFGKLSKETPLSLFSAESEEALSLFEKEELSFWEGMALARHPAIQENELRVRRSLEGVKKAKSRYAPTVSAYSNYNLKNGRSETGLSLSLPLIDSFSSHHKIGQAKETLAAERLSLERKTNHIKMEVRNRLFEIEEALLAFMTSRSSISYAEKALKIARERRDIGTITALEYRDAAWQLTVARQAMTKNALDLLLAYYGLRRDAALDLGSLHALEGL